MRILLLLLVCGIAAPAAAIDCSSTPSAVTVGGHAVAPGLDPPATDRGTPLFGEQGGDLSVAAVLQRLHDAECARPQLAADGYQKQTEFDNTPYRYNMKPGQKLNAAEFDAWMQSRGIRIVKARVQAPVEGAAAEAAPAAVAE